MPINCFSPHPHQPKSYSPAETGSDALATAGSARATDATDLHPPPTDGDLPTSVGQKAEDFTLIAKVPIFAPDTVGVDSAAWSNLGDKLSHIASQHGNDASSAGSVTGSSSTSYHVLNPPPQFNMYMITSLFLQEGLEGFREELQAGTLSANQQMAALDRTADELEAGAQKRLIGSIVQGVGQGVSGFAQIASSGINMNTARNANSALNQTTGLDATTRGQEFNRLTAQANGIAGMVQGSGQFSQAMMGTGAAVTEQGAAAHDAAKVRADKAATAYAAQHDMHTAFRQQYLSMIQDALQTAKSYEQSQAQMMQNAAKA